MNPTEPLSKLLEYHNLSDRKKHLLAIACAKRALPIVNDERIYNTIIVLAEQYADKRRGYSKLGAAENMANYRNKYYTHQERHAALAIVNLASAKITNQRIVCVAYCAAEAFEDKKQEEEHQLTIFYDIANHPCNIPIPTDPLIISLAKHMYDTNDFSDMPILHDMLLDNNVFDYVLDHTKKTTHSKGCWLLDQILGKK